MANTAIARPPSMAIEPAATGAAAFVEVGADVELDRVLLAVVLVVVVLYRLGDATVDRLGDATVDRLPGKGVEVTVGTVVTVGEELPGLEVVLAAVEEALVCAVVVALSPLDAPVIWKGADHWKTVESGSYLIWRPYVFSVANCRGQDLLTCDDSYFGQEIHSSTTVQVDADGAGVVAGIPLDVVGTASRYVFTLSRFGDGVKSWGLGQGGSREGDDGSGVETHSGR
jgi:hypothetical protein